MPEEEKEFNLSPRIEELQDKLAKNPKSRLFLQLAEEYRKSGMAEEAVTICQEGLKNHPTYISAKVTLGKAYIDLKKIDEAQQVFEEVIEQAPDNLMANRNLGDIYYMKGYAKEAIKHYKVINMFNPNDQVIAERIEELTAQKAEPEPIKISEESQTAETQDIAEEEITIETTANQVGKSEVPEFLKDKEQEVEKEEPQTLELESEIKEESPVVLEPEEMEEVKPIELKEEIKEEEPPLELKPELKEELPPIEKIEEKDTLTKAEVDIESEEVTEEEKIPEVQIDLTGEEVDQEEAVPALELDLTAVPEQEILEDKTSEEQKTIQPIEEQMPGKELISKEKVDEGTLIEVEQERRKHVGEIPVPPAAKEEIASVTLAELYEKQGLIDKAIETYQRLLKGEPNNIEYRNKLEQLILKKISKVDVQPPPKTPEKKVEEPSVKKKDIPDSTPVPPLDEKKKEKIDTLNKWLENIRKLK